MYRLHGAMLVAVAAPQAVVVADDEGLDLVDGTFRTSVEARATADAVVADFIALRLSLGVAHGEIVAAPVIGRYLVLMGSL